MTTDAELDAEIAAVTDYYRREPTGNAPPPISPAAERRQAIAEIDAHRRFAESRTIKTLTFDEVRRQMLAGTVSINDLRADLGLPRAELAPLTGPVVSCSYCRTSSPAARLTYPTCGAPR